ncbi:MULTISPECIES: response regulator [Pseudomonas]|uniref:response regulator n=1 Tax=Pseudomonas TaxID=286 RepID=UPI0003094E67|nr:MULTISPECIES: response regulator [Pseudomonas]AIC20359.1 histidine kinase [Pseudomonas chlororaphis]AZE05434.1 sensor histidine kinase/response regulator [Pseudomonas chlororaphis subsp. aureofaciens]AZE23840.1 sensor histidine kinase/response regulator [Pseudomonas chlororaphis subsp. aureofaciens]AZE36397.1 sensor histidine kinase/response regulator [Pseudomonas chlororaphis subsp. aureofaciens]AZE42744.1 sensor histidine kinase/response regulator [Pseudomonas chlororaphis subsp. aureofac
MRLKTYLHQISPVFSSPEAASRLLRLFALILLVGILGAVYNFLNSTLSNDISRRRGYMSSAIAEAQTFFTSREALLESLSLSAVRRSKQAQALVYLPSTEELHLQLGDLDDPWSIWLSVRMREYFKAKQVNLLYVSPGPEARVMRLYSSNPTSPNLPRTILSKLEALNHGEHPDTNELWLTDPSTQTSQLYIFTRLDERTDDSGWLGLEMDGREVLKALSDQSAGEFMMFNSEGALLFTNTPAGRLGQALQQLQGSNFFGFVGSRWWPDHLVIRKQLMTSDWQLVYSFSLQSLLIALWPQLAGALVFCLFSISLICLLTRRIEHRFITPALSRIQALVESELFSRDVIQTAPVALCVLRRTDGQVVLENTLAQQWLGDGIEREILCAGWIQQAFKSHEPNRFDYFETADGRHLYLSSAPTRYKGEDVLFCAFSDISARKQVEAALEEARQMADAANEAKTLFLATMSHEIRTPLYGVLGTLELLARTQLDTQQRDYLRAIECSSSTLLQLICDVLDVSKIEAGQLALELNEFSPLDLVHELIQGYSAAASNKGLLLYSCVDPQIPERLIGDVTRIRQILSNLLNNAVKFTDLGRIVLRVNLLSRDGERSSILWQVSDTGKGIAQDHQPLIFEPFYQTGGNTNVVAGTGLGLPICQRLTQLMNGSLRMVSELGLGSSFSLTLPLEAAIDGPVTLPATQLLPETIYVMSSVRELAESIGGWLRQWGARVQLCHPSKIAPTSDCLLVEVHPGELEQRLQPDWPGPLILATGTGNNEPQVRTGCWHVNLNHLRSIHQAVSQAQGLWVAKAENHNEHWTLKQLDLKVLVAEDNVINQLILRDQLEELGCSVELASNGEEALSMWNPERFDLVLTDVNMPVMNGYELAKELRRRGCTVPIIGATANAMRGEEEQCLAAGMNHCLVKPFALRALFNYLAPYERAKNEAL